MDPIDNKLKSLRKNLDEFKTLNELAIKKSTKNRPLAIYDVLQLQKQEKEAVLDSKFAKLRHEAEKQQKMEDALLQAEFDRIDKEDAAKIKKTPKYSIFKGLFGRKEPNKEDATNNRKQETMKKVIKMTPQQEDALDAELSELAEKEGWGGKNRKTKRRNRNKKQTHKKKIHNMKKTNKRKN